jgi:transglutaminase-like putative cysteine protease
VLIASILRRQGHFMPRILIDHATTYGYRRPVGLMPHRLMLRPQDSHDLRLNAATLSVDPPPAATRWAHDVFGNSICMLEWPAALRTTRLAITSRLDLLHYPSGAALPRAALDPTAETFPFAYAADEALDVARLAERQLPDPDRAVDAWAARFLQNGRGQTLGILEAMTGSIRAEFRYLARDAEGTQPPVETLNRGSGTCRDFALLMMEAVRSLGLAARFVTGYLYDEALQGMTGGGATHAWCSVYLPGAGWLEYDPTNGLVAGRNLVRVGVARTPQQAVPIAGGFLGDVSDMTGLAVDLTVTVADALAGRAGSAAA